MKNLTPLLLSIFILSMKAAALNDSTVVETKITLQTNTGEIYGTLTTPEHFSRIPVALIIAGSGPTDRDGNNPMMKNNSLKILAEELCKNGIASLRYDKRGIAESAAAGKKEADLRFDDYVNDAREWLQLLKIDKRFSSFIIIGHSEGSLIGMMAATYADKFVSIAGAGRPADEILKAQLGTQPEAVKNLAFPIIDSLKNGKTAADVPPMLLTLFRPSVQPYIISWFRYNPQTEIKKLTIPVLIIQGTNDIQVGVEDAKWLSALNPTSGLVLIPNMNHIFRIITGDRQANLASYSKADLPVAEELIKSITGFILRD